VVERIRSLLARFSENEETVRRLVATDARFDALCEEYREIIERQEGFEAETERLRERLEGLEVETERLRERKALLEDELLTRIEGYQPK
jgi:predicted nuclease with TOPRIM domain